MKHLLLMTLLLAPFATQAKIVSGVIASPNCTQQETATVAVSFNSVESDLNGIQSKFDKKIKEIIDTSKEAGVEKLNLTSKNYSVNAQGDNGQYSVSGNLSFAVIPSGKATDFLVRLSKKGHKANLNMNAYTSGGPGCSINIGGMIDAINNGVVDK